MMLTMTPKTRFAGRSAWNDRTASEVMLQAIGIVGGGIRVVILGDSSLIQGDSSLVSGDGSHKSNLFTTEIPINNRCHFYRYEAAATDQSKPRRGDDRPSKDGGRDGGVLSGQRWC